VCASAIEGLLKQLPTDKLRVFVVWEPILPSDWQSPTNPVLSRIPDLRVSQYWDQDHLVAKLVKEHIPPDQPNCCDKRRSLGFGRAPPETFSFEERAFIHRWTCG
jgi:hypothetical protein